MVTLNLLGLTDLVPRAQEASAKIVGLRDALKKTDIKDATTAAYVLSRLELAVTSNAEVETFITGNIAGILSPLSASKRNELGAKLDAVFLKAGQADLAQINIDNEADLNAANSLLEMLKTFQSFFPDEVNEHLAKTHQALSQKITAYQKEHDHVASDTADSALPTIETLEALNEYIKTEHKSILEETAIDIRIERYQALYAFAKTIRDNLPMHNEDYMEALELIDAVEDAREKDKKIIADEYKALIEAFNTSVDGLRTQANTIKSETTTNNYSTAIMHAETLVKVLDHAMALFQTTNNLNDFKEIASTALTAFPKEAVFDVNESSSWFKKHIANPFKELSKGLKSLFHLGHHSKTIEHAEKSRTLRFFGRQEDTVDNTNKKRAFDSLQEGIEHLGQDEQHKKFKPQ
ncbi:MAG: hypothetical protein P1U32_06855 [Legionellaceae bacterium]|nr:hypothetical protein [Legionellaceae bacterium]